MELLKEYCLRYGIKLDNEMLESFSRYFDLLIEWNNKFNLTALTEKEAVIEKHFLDSLIPEHYFEGSVLDVGSGAGFPGIPLAIYRKDLSLTMIDSLNKRVNFLTEVLRVLGLKGEALHLTSEEANGKGMRGKFDCVTARAVAPMSILLDLTLPLAKVGGKVILYKGVPSDEEKSSLLSLAKEMGFKQEDYKSYSLPDGSERTLYVLRKISPTPNKYPRKNLRKLAK